MANVAWHLAPLVATEVFAECTAHHSPKVLAQHSAAGWRKCGFAARVFPRTLRADTLSIPCWAVVVRSKN